MKTIKEEGDKTTSMKIAICGGGPSALTLAAILSREGGDDAFDISVFERGEATRDQGSGWDLSSESQAALKRAGLDPDDVQRHGSDTMRFFSVTQERPLYCMRMPPILERAGMKKDHIGLDMLGLESERNKIIDGLTSALGTNVKIYYESYVGEVKKDEVDGTVELVGRDGRSYGKFDLIVDASGVNSSVRHCRFGKKADAFYTGQTFIQGKLDNPEKTLAPSIVDRLGEGTLSVVGPSADGKGTTEFWLQRYGAAFEDKLATVNLTAYTEKPEDLFEELNIGRGGINSEENTLKRVEEYAKNRLSNDGWSEEYREIFDNISGARILPIKMHPSRDITMKEVVPGSDSLPFIGIGDSLHALPPWSGMSGNYALMDAADLATALVEEQKSNWTPSSIARLMRAKEEVFMERTEDKREHCLQVNPNYKKSYLQSTPVDEFDFISAHIIGKPFSWTNIIAVFIAAYLRCITLLNRIDNYGMRQ